MLLQIGGPDARDFLQTLITNDLDDLKPGGAIYAALLTPQGKYLHDFLVVDRRGEMLLDVAAARAEDLVKRLTLYRLRRKVTVEQATNLSVSLVWGEEPPSMDDATIVPDPRDPALGWRVYAPASASLKLAGSAANYDVLRISLGVPLTDMDLLADKTYPLEAGFDRLHGVSFTKGCYVGQEVTARMRHKTTLKKGIVRVAISGEADAGAELTVDGRAAGQLLSVSGDRGLAHLRFDRAEKGDVMAGDAVITVLQ